MSASVRAEGVHHSKTQHLCSNHDHRGSTWPQCLLFPVQWPRPRPSGTPPQPPSDVRGHRTPVSFVTCHPLVNGSPLDSNTSEKCAALTHTYWNDSKTKQQPTLLMIHWWCWASSCADLHYDVARYESSQFAISRSAFWGFGVCCKPNGGLKLCSHPRMHFLFLLPNLYSAPEEKEMSPAPLIKCL